MRISTALWFSLAVFLTVLVIKVPDWDHPRTAAVQTGFSPAGMMQFTPRAETVYGFFPDAGFAEYYLQDNPVEAEAREALAGGREPPRQAVAVKRVYEMMMQMSVETGLNCTSCLNSRSFKAWDQSTPQRWVGFHALSLMRDINRNHLLPLSSIVPQSRQLVDQNPAPVLPARDRAPQPGAALATCGTCHYGLPKPLNGAKLIDGFPSLMGSSPASPDADPHGALTKAPLDRLQKPGLAATENQTGALR